MPQPLCVQRLLGGGLKDFIKPFDGVLKGGVKTAVIPGQHQVFMVVQVLGALNVLIQWKIHAIHLHSGKTVLLNVFQHPVSQAAMFSSSNIHVESLADSVVVEVHVSKGNLPGFVVVGQVHQKWTLPTSI